MFNKEDLQFIQQNLSNNKVLVVGDVMLDRYWFGDASRISPEAPVPIVKVDNVEDRLGGAANVARNIASLGGNVTLLSVVGIDEPSIILEKLLLQDGVKAVLKKDSTISTIVKLRVLAKHQQLIRLDFEERPSHEILADLLDVFKDTVEQYQVIIFSDYGKGGLDHVAQMIKIAKSHHKIVLVDPKGIDYSKYMNSTIITPNRLELAQALGIWRSEADLVARVRELKSKLSLDYVLLTRSEDGMTLFGNEAVDYPTLAQDVFDVSGAGDTVIATLGLMLANGAEISFAVRMANLAAGIVVAKLGTATITKQELLHKVESYFLLH